MKERKKSKRMGEREGGKGRENEKKRQLSNLCEGFLLRPKPPQWCFFLCELGQEKYKRQWGGV